MLKNIIRRIIKWASEDDSLKADYSVAQPSLRTDDFRNGTDLSIFKADGGTIIRTRYYDRIKDVMHENLYVIQGADDIGEELSQIITREMLSR